MKMSSSVKLNAAFTIILIILCISTFGLKYNKVTKWDRKKSFENEVLDKMIYSTKAAFNNEDELKEMSISTRDKLPNPRYRASVNKHQPLYPAKNNHESSTSKGDYFNRSGTYDEAFTNTNKMQNKQIKIKHLYVTVKDSRNGLNEKETLDIWQQLGKSNEDDLWFDLSDNLVTPAVNIHQKILGEESKLHNIIKYNPHTTKSKETLDEIIDLDTEIKKVETVTIKTTVGRTINYQKQSIPMQSMPSSLLGPLNGPDWMLDNTQLPSKKPLDTITGVEGTFLWAVGLFGTVENGAVVLTAIFSHHFKKPLHILIGTLAATDLFTSVIYIPVYTYYLLEGEQPQETDANLSPWNFCSISRLIFIEIASVTLTIKVLISLYLNLISYSKALAEEIFTTKTTLLYIMLAWITNFGLLFIPNFMGFSNIDFYPNGVICIPVGDTLIQEKERSRSLLAYTLVTLSLHVTELLIICICFIKVHRAIQLGRSIWQQNVKTINFIKDKRSCNHQSYHRAKKITILFFINFVFCWIPIYVVNVVDPSHKTLPEIVHHLAMDLLLLKSAINPAIFIYGIRSLRRELKFVCMCRCNNASKNAKFDLYRTSMDSFASNSNSTKTAQMV